MSTRIRSLTQHQQINFLLTNRVPRLLLTRCMGWYSRIESPLLTRISIAIWQIFGGDLNLDEAEKQSFRSLQDCFTRKLTVGARTVVKGENIVTSPCDGIVGACGAIEGDQVYQAKGFPYQLNELIADPDLVELVRNGVYVTLRLKSNMYHRFHAPTDCRVSEVIYQSGDTWNVNPIALARIEKLYCKNERAVIKLQTDEPGRHLILVPVAAILVASMKFNCLEHELDLRYRGPNRLACDASYRKGEEMGYFQQGSTIILFASKGFELSKGIETGMSIKMGEPLLVKST